MLDIKIKKLNENAVIPSYSKPGDAGLDLTAASVTYDAAMDAYIYGTGLAIEIPKGYVGLVFPRSSNRKTNLYLTNHVGVIDSGYRGEVMATFKLRDADPLSTSVSSPYKVGDRVCQLIIIPYPEIHFTEVDELSETERGTSGHGSTGK